MKKLLSKIKENNRLIKEIDSNEFSKGVILKVTLFTLLFGIIVALPFVLIFVELLKQFSPVVWFFYVVLVLIFICVILFIPFCMMIYYTVLKNYSKKEEIEKINTKLVFLGELLNPIYLILGIGVVLILFYFLG